MAQTTLAPAVDMHDKRPASTRGRRRRARWLFVGVIVSVLTLAAPAIAGAATLQATVHARISGTIHAAKLKLNLPFSGAQLTTTLNLNTSKLTGGSLSLPSITVHRPISLIGTARVSVVQAGPFSGRVVPATQQLDATVPATIRVDYLSLRASTTNVVGKTCHTASPVSIHLSGKLSLSKPFQVRSTFAIGKFVGCGIVTPVVTLMLSSTGNTLVATVTPTSIGA